MKKLDNRADMNMVLTAVVMAIVFAIGIIIVFNVHSAVTNDLSTLDDDLENARAGGNTTSGQTATNSSDDLLSNIETFYTIGPIALIVIAAVGILSYVMLLRRQR